MPAATISSTIFWPEAMFLALSRHPADAMVLEVGLGGKYDATNVVPKPAMTVVQPVGLDHVEFLGDDIATIAGDCAIFTSDASGNWRCRSYQRATIAGRAADIMAAGPAGSALTTTGLGVGVSTPTEALETYGCVAASYQSNNFGTGNARAFMDYVPGTGARFGQLKGASGSAQSVRFIVGGDDAGREHDARRERVEHFLLQKGDQVGIAGGRALVRQEDLQPLARDGGR